jgi:4-aminobutyrate aminotransferase-like enzyme
VRLIPPLVIDKTTADQALEILDAAIGDMERKYIG